MNFAVHLFFGLVVGFAGVAACLSRGCFTDLSLLEILVASGLVGAFMFLVLDVSLELTLAVSVISLAAFVGMNTAHRGWMHSWLVGFLYGFLVLFSASSLGVGDPMLFAVFGFVSVFVHLLLDGIPFKIA